MQMQRHGQGAVGRIRVDYGLKQLVGAISLAAFTDGLASAGGASASVGRPELRAPPVQRRRFHTRAEAGLFGLACSDVRLHQLHLALATLCLVTDYDCWKTDEAAVDVAAVVANLHANSALAKDIIKSLIPTLPTEANWPEHRSLDTAILTPVGNWPSKTTQKLKPILGRFL